MKEKTIKELEKELEELKESNKSAWDTYGSELCAGDMIGREKALEKEILRRRTIKRWEKTGLLDEQENPIPSKSLQTLKLADELLIPLMEGKKKITIRRGRRDIQLDKLKFETVSGMDEVEVDVVEVRYVRVSDVSEKIYKQDGFSDYVDFYRGMKKFYPDLDVSDECTVIIFK